MAEVQSISEILTDITENVKNINNSIKINHGLVISAEGVRPSNFSAYLPCSQPKFRKLNMPFANAVLKFSTKQRDTFLFENHIDYYAVNLEHCNWISANPTENPLTNESPVNDVCLKIQCSQFELMIDKDMIKPSKEMVAKIKKALKHYNPYNELMTIFEIYGKFLPKKVILGHKIYRVTCLIVDKNQADLNIKEGEQSANCMTEEYYDILNQWEKCVGLYGFDSSYFVSVDDKIIMKDEIEKWMELCNYDSLQIISWNELFPIYEIFEDSLCQEIKSILGIIYQPGSFNIKERVLFSGIIPVNNPPFSYRVNFPVCFKSNNYQLFGKLVKENGVPIDKVAIKFKSMDIYGFYAFVENFNSIDEHMDLQIEWILIGIPAKIGFFSMYTRNIQILRSINTSFSLKPNNNNWKILLDVQEDLPHNSVLVTSFNNSSNYERSFEVDILNYWYNDNKIELNVYYANYENPISSTMEICDPDKDNFMNTNVNGDEPKCLIQCFILSLESQDQLVVHLNAIGKTIGLEEEIIFKLQNVEINPRARKQPTIKDAAEASENFVPFAPLIEIFFKLGEDIVTLYQKAEHNKQICNFLIKPVNSAVASIKDLEIRKQDNQEFFKETANLQLIKDFVKCMLDIRKFVADVSQLGSFGTFFNSNHIIQRYKDLSNKFDGYLASLNFAMNRDAILYLQRINTDNGELKAQINKDPDMLEAQINKDPDMSKAQINKDLDDMLNAQIMLKKKDLEMRRQISIIMKDLVEMKKFMQEMSDSKEKNSLTNIKRIRDLNVSYQRNLRKGTEVSIEHQSFLNLDDYELKVDIPPRGKTIHCRWNNIFLLHYAFKEIPQITEDQKKDLSQQVAILKEMKDSEHIIRFYGIAVTSDETKSYLVTEWMENGNLQDYYKSHKLDWNKRFEFAIDICRGIAFLNAVEILHHDIRGASILINRDHKAKLANFGLSRRFGDITRNIQANLENVRYMAPEKLEHGDKKRYNVKCEIYSLGALLWEIAEEEIPYTRLGKDLQTIRDKVVKERYREPFSLNVPKVWQDTAYAALNYDPDFRPTIAKIFSALYEYHHKDKKRELQPIGDEFEDAFILDDFDSGIMSVDRAIEEHRKPDGNKQKAWESFKYHAELGDILAKYWVGYFLYHSILPEHKENRQANLQHAAILFKEAADHGEVEAQLRYGFCLWQGDGVPVNWDEAMRYLKLAADNGNPTAMYNVGSAYWIGKGVIKDQEIGSKYLKMAAKKDQHNAIAMCKKLGITY